MGVPRPQERKVANAPVVIACMLAALVAGAGCKPGRSGAHDLHPPDAWVPDDVAVLDAPDVDVPVRPLACRLAPEPVSPDPEAPVALFGLGADLRSPPFPFDLFTRANPGSPTGRAVDLGAVNSELIDGGIAFIQDMLDVRAFLGEIDGFSTFGAILFGFTAPVGPADLAGKALLVKLDPKTGTCGAPIATTASTEQTLGDTDVKTLLVMRPQLPLDPASTYVALITRELHGSGAATVASHPHFRFVTGQSPDSSGIAPDLAAAATRVLAPLSACLASLDPPLCPGDLAAATLYTTRDGTAPLRGIRDALLSATPALRLLPDRDDSGAIVTGPASLLARVPEGQDWSASSIALHGSFNVPDFRGTDQDVHYAGVGTPQSSGTLKVPFVLVLPAAAPPGPLKVAVMEHGHSGRKEEVAYLAKRFGEQGFALASIDLIGHGELASEGEFLTGDVHVARGSFMQSAANLVAFLQALRTLDTLDILPAGAPDGVPDLDLASGFVFVGESLGSLIGATAGALDPAVHAVVLNVGGGGLVNVAAASVDPILGSEDRMTYWALKTLLQAVVDGFDPITFAGLLAGKPSAALAPRSVLMQAVIGDSAFEGPPTDDLARALGLTYVCPCPKDVPSLDIAPAPADGSGLFYYDKTAAHGFLLANASNPAASDAARHQAAVFLRTAMDGQARVEDFQASPP